VLAADVAKVAQRRKLIKNKYKSSKRTKKGKT